MRYKKESFPFQIGLYRILDMVPVGEIGNAGNWEYTKAFTEISSGSDLKDHNKIHAAAMKRMLDLRPDLRKRANELYDPMNIFRASRFEDVSATIHMLGAEHRNYLATKLRNKIFGEWWP